MSNAKTVLITGASDGIGQVMAKRFAKDGFHVFVSARTVEKAQPIVDAILAEGGKAEPLAMDLSDVQSIQEAASSLQKRDIQLSALINNAG